MQRLLVSAVTVRVTGYCYVSWEKNCFSKFFRVIWIQKKCWFLETQTRFLCFETWFARVLSTLWVLSPHATFLSIVWQVKRETFLKVSKSGESSFEDLVETVNLRNTHYRQGHSGELIKTRFRYRVLFLKYNEVKKPLVKKKGDWPLNVS